MRTLEEYKQLDTMFIEEINVKAHRRYIGHGDGVPIYLTFNGKDYVWEKGNKVYKKATNKLARQILEKAYE